MAASDSASLYPPVAALPAAWERLGLIMLWLTGFTGALVFIEPSPYEVASLASLAIFAIGGLALPRAIIPLVVLLILINIGYTALGVRAARPNARADLDRDVLVSRADRGVLCRHVRRQHRRHGWPR